MNLINMVNEHFKVLKTQSAFAQPEKLDINLAFSTGIIIEKARFQVIIESAVQATKHIRWSLVWTI